MPTSYHDVEWKMIKLHIAIKVPHETPREFDLSFDKASVTIGRDADNDIQIPLSTVSRHHARLVFEMGDWFIEDLQSIHSTEVNHQILGSGGRKLLRSGDEIQVVHAFIEFNEEHLSQLPNDAPEEQTSVVARQMVQEVLRNLDSNSDAPHLVIMNGPLQGRKIELLPNMAEMLIGRGDTCDIRLDDVNISRRHAKLTRRWNDILIEDLKSKNGVVIAGHSITRATKLHDADEIMIGPIKLVFVDTTASLLGKLGEMPAFAKEVAAAPPPVAEELSSETANQETQIPPPPVPTEIPEPPPPVKTGLVDYVLYGLAAFVVIGLIVGVALAFME